MSQNADSILLGAVSEIFEEMLAQQQVFENKPNHYLTAEDHKLMVTLKAENNRLRKREGVPNLIPEAISLLQQATATFTSISRQCSAITGTFRENTESHKRKARKNLLQESPALYCLAKLNRITPEISRALRMFDTDTSALTKPGTADLKSVHSGESFRHLKQQLEDLHAEAKNNLAPLRNNVQNITEEATRKVPLHQYLRLPTESGGKSKTTVSIHATGTYDFLQYSKPPQLGHFKCSDALSFFLNVTEDIAAGTITIPSAPRISNAYTSFTGALRKLDDDLTKISRLPTQADSHLSETTHAANTLVKGLTPDVAAESASVLLTRIAEANSFLAVATKLARYGDLALSKGIADKAFDHGLGFLDETEFKQIVDNQKQVLDRLASSFKKAFDTASIQANAAASVGGFFRSLTSSTKAVDELLDSFYKHQWDLKVGAGTEVSKAYIAYAQKLVAVISHQTPQAPWFTLTAHMAQCKPRALTQPAIFLNALCAMAMISEDLDPAEETVIKKALETAYGPKAVEQAGEHIAAWKGVPKGRQRLRNISQAITDVQGLQPGHARQLLPQFLSSIAKADGKLDQNETAAYLGFLSALLRTDQQVN